MGRKPFESEPTKWAPLCVVLLGLLSFFAVSIFISTLYGPLNGSKIRTLENLEGENGEKKGGCCRGIDNLELWGTAVKWGSEFKMNSSQECCKACKDMCSGNDGPCLCDSWVFCGNRMACREKFGECWLKKQKDTLVPDRLEAGGKGTWTSGLVFGKGEGIISMETEYGTLRIKLLPDCSPHSIFYILELLGFRHCAGCQFYRAESQGKSWDSQGNHIEDASYGPPFALIQGTLEAQGVKFNTIPTEFCPTIKRGSVAWIDSGPEFFISLANHDEWKKTYTVFGYVLSEDMAIADKIAELPTKPDVWSRIDVSVLEKPVPLKLRRIKATQGDENLSSNV